MPRFPVAFRRKSTAQEDTNGAIAAEPSFRVLDRGDANGKSFDGGARMAAARSLAASRPKTSNTEFGTDDNIFAGMTHNRYVNQVSFRFLWFSFSGFSFLFCCSFFLAAVVIVVVLS